MNRKSTAHRFCSPFRLFAVTRSQTTLLVLTLLSLPWIAQGTNSVPQSNTAMPPAPADVKAAVNRSFGPSVEPAGDRKPYYWTGDFNGDGVPDMLALVRLKGPTRALPKDVSALNFWNAGSLPALSGKEPQLALAIIHGGGAAAAPAGKYLIHSKDFFSTPVWASTSTADLISVVRKGAKRSGAVRLPASARGDAISLATEAGIDTYVYWNGKTYRLFEPTEAP
jgi:hypothetical protein